MSAHTPENDALTAEQVAALPEGTPVTITWSGGNGPHDYVLVFDDHGQPYAALTDDPRDRLRYYNPLTFVGQERYHTRVWPRPTPPVACACGHPSDDHDDAGACMHLCDCAWPKGQA